MVCLKDTTTEGKTMTFQLDPNRRLRQAGTYPVLLPGPNGEQTACTVTVEQTGRAAAYTLTLDEDGTVIDALHRRYVSTDGGAGWFGSYGTEYFYGLRAEHAWHAWIDQAVRRVATGEFITDTYWKARTSA